MDWALSMWKGPLCVDRAQFVSNKPIIALFVVLAQAHSVWTGPTLCGTGTLYVDRTHTLCGRSPVYVAWTGPLCLDWYHSVWIGSTLIYNLCGQGTLCGTCSICYIIICYLYGLGTLNVGSFHSYWSRFTVGLLQIQLVFISQSELVPMFHTA